MIQYRSWVLWNWVGRLIVRKQLGGLAKAWQVYLQAGKTHVEGRTGPMKTDSQAKNKTRTKGAVS